MADNDTPQEDRTEEPTEKRLRESREEGQVPRSRELTAAVVMIACTGLLIATAEPMGVRIAAILTAALSFDLRAIAAGGGPLMHFAKVAAAMFTLALPVIGLGVLCAVIGNVGLGGFNIATKALVPKLERVDPIAGFKRLFSLPALGEVATAFLRIAIVGAVAVIVIATRLDEIQGLAGNPDRGAILHAISIVGWTLLALAASLGLIALLDVPFQSWRHRRQLRMTLEEVKREIKETEGSPEVKGRIRQLQREMAQHRMMDAVPTADVVLVNPTHYAVALKYEQGRMRAPRVVAKGRDLVALAIRELAEKNRVPIVSAPPLARALYRSVEIGQEIPAQLYQAVAQVLTFVFQLKVYRRHGGKEPVLGDIKVDESST